MRSLAYDLTSSVGGWAAPALILALTVFAAVLARVLVRKIGESRHAVVAQQLAPSIANVIFVVGFSAFVDAAPLHPKILLWLDRAVYVFGVFVVLGIVRRAALIAIEWSTIRSNHSKTLQQGFIPLMRNLITLFVFFAGTIMILKRFNYDVMSLVTALGVGSLAVGLAAQPTISNMISGFTLIIDRNLRPGDRINLGTWTGDVEEIGLRSTRIRTGNGNTLIVPNSELVNTKILNLSQPSRATICSTQLRVVSQAPFPRVREICQEVIATLAKADQRRGSWVLISGVADGALTLNIGFWVPEMDDSGGVISEFHEKTLQRLAQERIALAPPAFPPPAPT